MTVPNIPFWLSDANTEFGGNGWATDICAKAGLALPANLKDLAGRSNWSGSIVVGSKVSGLQYYGFNTSEGIGSIAPAVHSGVTVTGIYTTSGLIVSSTYGGANIGLQLEGLPEYTLTKLGAQWFSADGGTAAKPFFAARVGQRVNFRIRFF
ncbi:hypothetical protein HQ400_07880 [Aeromonas jandaei]|nr:hypothetical protein HQ400_07880 [Aeromonas jandaei]